MNAPQKIREMLDEAWMSPSDVNEPPRPALVTPAASTDADPPGRFPPLDASDRETRQAPPANEVPVDVDALFAGCRVTEDFVKNLQDAHFVWRRIAAAAHIVVWAAPAGSGKSMIGRLAADEMARDGLKVLYFMEDAGATDFNYLERHARDHGYTLINSTAGNKSPDEIFSTIRTLSTSGARLEGYVFILDTLKKFMDVMGKKGARDFFKVLRAITTLGGTVLLLGHTNKHKGIDGKLIFEGVGDIRNDVDELFYIEAVDDGPPGGDRLATITPDKLRCMGEAASFRLERATLQAIDAPLTDVAALAAAAQREKEDGHIILAIEAILRVRSGESQEKLVSEVAQSVEVGVNRVRTVIRDYSDTALGTSARWNVTSLSLNNERRVSWPPGRPK